MRKPRLRINAALCNQIDDARKVRTERVATRHERQLAPMDDRGMGKHQVFHGDADIDNPSRKRGELETAAHGFVVAGGVNDHVGKLTLGEFTKRLERVRSGDDCVGHFQFVAHKCEPLFIEIKNDHPRAGDAGEFNHGQTDRPSTEHENIFSRLRLGTIHSVASNGERFDQRELFKSELSGKMKLARGNIEEWAKPAIAMNAECLMILAAIRVSSTTRVAVLAVDVRLNGAAVAGLDVCYAITHGDNFHAQLVPGNPRIGEERHLAEVAAVIRAADADSMYAHARFALTGRREFGRLDNLKIPWLNKLDRSHVVLIVLRQTFEMAEVFHGSKNLLHIT